ncbi:hypothetical protein BaRGS_00028584 [Batillaria attramentaria]|uniref:Calcium-responsive transcription factor n=1 Tax=Batillaria attramentaria TaxID=370345 RepID=A0ABD0JYX0_9CAEN
MTKDHAAATNSTDVSVSTQAAVLVTLPNTTVTAGNGTQTVELGIKQESEEGATTASCASDVSGILTPGSLSTGSESANLRRFPHPLVKEFLATPSFMHTLQNMHGLKLASQSAADDNNTQIPLTSQKIRATHATLQSLLAAPISAARVITQPETIQVITLPTTSDLITTSQPDGAGRVWQVVPSIGNPEIATIIAVADPSELIQATKTDLGEGIDLDIHEASGDLSVATADGMAAILMPPPPAPTSAVLQNCPLWATRLQNCEKIGESYRGYVESEVQLDLLLTYHKQQTQSFWGTRQSPSPAKPSTRLMWKSQYVPFDGIPFVNIGSRAVVMECQYGPRRKGNAHKRYHDGSQANVYRQTCPARIYIKKVRKFPEYAVDLRQDKKLLRIAMDKAFHELRERQLDGWGQERYYVQLPTEKAHEFHDDGAGGTDKKDTLSLEGEMINGEDGEIEDVRLHPKVAQKIRSLVSGGETRVYAIRRQLRAYVLRELFAGTDTVPERHDLTLFPTVNDLKNHIHQALKDIENGSLPLTASTVNVEILPGEGNVGAGDMEEGEDRLSALLERGITASLPMPETVTVTLTQNPDEDGHHVISRIETHLSDGTTQVSTTLTPETARLLSKLHPGLFPSDSLLQLGTAPSQTSAEEPEPTPSLNVGVDSSSTLTNNSQNTAPGLPAGGEADVIEGSAEVMQIVNPDEACTQILPAAAVETEVPVQIAVTEEDGVIVAQGVGATEGKGEEVLVGDTEMITISMTDDSQLVLAAPVTEGFETQ